MTPRRPCRGRGGFALAMVVLLLFAIGVAATAAYQVVSTEFMLSTENRESGTALSVAQGGLQRFLAEQMGAVGDSDSYAIGSGIATVTARRVLEQDPQDYLYYIRSDGAVTDPRTPDSPARRSVATYAWLRMSPLKQKAAMLLAATGAAYYSSTVDGTDHCYSTPGVAGVASAGYTYRSWSASIGGNPAAQRYSSTAAVIDSAGIRWDILSDPNFPVEFDQAPPTNWDSIPADSFPVVRKVGNLQANYQWAGHGVLIVTGQLTFSYGFSWQGIILAGSLGSVGAYYSPQIQGTLVAGLNGTDGNVTIQSGVYWYNSCYVSDADKSLSYLEVVNHTVVGVNG